LQKADPTGESPEDVSKIYEAFRKCVDEMTAKKLRHPLSAINNSLPGTLDCGEQTEYVMQCLQNLKLDDNWTFMLRSGLGHAWRVAISSSSGDPPLYFDPRADRFSIEDRRSSCEGWLGIDFDNARGYPVGLPARPAPPRPSMGPRK
jgi:hypothetical protein